MREGHGDRFETEFAVCVEEEQQMTVLRQLSIENVQVCECLQGFPKVGASGLLGSVL
jgi:hypothetical protein